MRPAHPTGFSPRIMTLFGAAGAMLSVVQPMLPDDVDSWLRIVLAAGAAGITYILGQTHSGTGERKDRS